MRAAGHRVRRRHRPGLGSGNAVGGGDLPRAGRGSPLAGVQRRRHDPGCRGARRACPRDGKARLDRCSGHGARRIPVYFPSLVEQLEGGLRGTYRLGVAQEEIAVRLLQLRDLSRREPECPAHQTIEADLLAVVAAQTGQSPARMTTGAFWKAVAQLGGYLARRGDGPPGWKTLWKGWLRIQTLLEGVHLAAHLRL